MEKNIKFFVGLDVHKETIVVAVAESGREGARVIGTFAHDVPKLVKVLARLGPASQIHVVYEAGPTGYGLQRALSGKGYVCEVIAPSLIPKRAGDRIKTDRRDALKLARLHRAGELSAVQVPAASDEAMRDLCRARTDAVQDLRRGRAQRKAFLLRNGYRYTGKSAWSEAHRRYLRELVLPHPAQRVVLEDAIAAIGAAGERIARIEEQMEALLESWHMKPVVQALMGLRGFALTQGKGAAA